MSTTVVKACFLVRNHTVRIGNGHLYLHRKDPVMLGMLNQVVLELRMSVGIHTPVLSVVQSRTEGQNVENDV